MSFGTQTGVETPPAPDKNQGQTGKMTCKLMKKAENHENHPRRSWALNHMGNPSLIIALVLLVFSIPDSQFSIAQAQITDLAVSRQISLNVNGNSGSPPPAINLTPTDFAFDYNTTESDANLTNGSSASGSVSQT